MDDVFKVGDRVYLYTLGWGTVTEVLVLDIVINFDSINDTRYIRGGLWKLLSFTEYTLAGFSQERPEELPKEGDIVWIRNSFPDDWHIGYFVKKQGSTYLTSTSKNLDGWKNAGLEIRTNNPHANEQ